MTEYGGSILTNMQTMSNLHSYWPIHRYNHSCVGVPVWSQYEGLAYEVECYVFRLYRLDGLSMCVDVCVGYVRACE